MNTTKLETALSRAAHEVDTSVCDSLAHPDCVGHDREFFERALALRDQIRDELMDEAQNITDSEIRVAVTTWLAIKI